MTKDELIPVTDKIFIVDSPTSGRFPLAYAFLVLGTDTRALIDTGCGPKACRQVMETFEVDMVINSHCHPDHVAGNHLFKGRALWIPEERSRETGTVDLLSQRLLGPDQEAAAFWRNWVRTMLSMEDYEHTDTFGHGHVFDFGGVSLEAVHTPGHLADHYCFLEPGTNTLFSFDVDLSTFGPFYGNPEADIPEFEASMDKIMEMDPACVASSHRLPVQENVMDELTAFKKKITRNRNRIMKALDRAMTLDELCALKPIFGKYLPGVEVIYTFFERCMIEKHLEQMLEKGLIRSDGEKYFPA
ncbi:MAG: MBL fold metallo-hydrolase [Desulfobacterales bacterium]|nr:MBL fold metallo-hydrolase [Desulfobacterales bacterium]